MPIRNIQILPDACIRSSLSLTFELLTSEIKGRGHISYFSYLNHHWVRSNWKDGKAKYFKSLWEQENQRASTWYPQSAKIYCTMLHLFDDL